MRPALRTVACLSGEGVRKEAVLAWKEVSSQRTPPTLPFEIIQEALPWLVSLILGRGSKLVGTRLCLKLPPWLYQLFLWQCRWIFHGSSGSLVSKPGRWVGVVNGESKAQHQQVRNNSAGRYSSVPGDGSLEFFLNEKIARQEWCGRYRVPHKMHGRDGVSGKFWKADSILMANQFG